MPMDDFRAQVDAEEPSFDLLRHCAKRYDVSLMAAMLKWIELAPKRTIVLAVRDDHVLWARSNRAAFISGAYLAARKMTIPVPSASIMHSRNCKTQTAINKIPAFVWFRKEPVDMPLTEISFVANQYGITLGILLLPDAQPRYWHQDKNETDDTGLESTIDLFERRGQTNIR